MPKSPTPPPGTKGAHKDVVPIPKELRDMPDPTTMTKAQAIAWYVKAYNQGWMDSAAHYEIEEYTPKP